MKEVVWIFGNSAAGKETFIKYAIESGDKELFTRLGWENKKVKAISASIDNIGQYENDPVTLKRDDILTETPRILEEVDVALIKWQTVDTQKGRIEKLMNLLPNTWHRIILLSTPARELEKRLPNKSWWDDDDVNAFIEEETKNLEELISSLKDKLPVTKISGNPKDYYQTSD